MSPELTPQIEQLLTAEEVSAVTKIPVNTLRDWRVPGRGPGLPWVKFGGHPRYRRQDIEAFVLGNLQPGNQVDPRALKLAMHDNPRIAALAAKFAFAKLKYVQTTGYALAIRAAVAQTVETGKPAEQYLLDQLAIVEAETAAFNAWAKQEAERYATESKELQPLNIALLKVETALTMGRDSLLAQIHGAEAAFDERLAKGRNAGLSEAEMATLGRYEPTSVTVPKLRAEIEQIDAKLAKIANFYASPLRETHHLEGLNIPGFPCTATHEVAGAAS